MSEETFNTTERTVELNKFLMEHRKDDMVIVLALNDENDENEEITVTTFVDGASSELNVVYALADTFMEMISEHDPLFQRFLILELNDYLTAQINERKSKQ